ncbi:MAG: hypothetical protein ACREJ2_09855 [Planctomycetota bacterium]
MPLPRPPAAAAPTAVSIAPPGPIEGLDRCPVTPDGWLLPAPGYPWPVSRRHYIFWEAIFAMNYLWIGAACYNLNMTTLWSTLPLILWMMVVVRGSVLFTSLYARVCSTALTPLVVASYAGNLVLTLILLTHMALSGAQYSPISVFTAFELSFELFVLAMTQVPAYRWPLRFWMLRREPTPGTPAPPPNGSPTGSPSGAPTPSPTRSPVGSAPAA